MEIDSFNKLSIGESSGKVHPEDSNRSPSHSRSNSDSSHRSSQVGVSSTIPEELLEVPSNGLSSRFKIGSSYNTGVKGVIADAYSYQAHKQSRKESLRGDSSRISIEESAEVSLTSALEEISSEDEEVMSAWRKKRLAELKSSVDCRNHQVPTKRVFAKVETVDESGYLNAVEKSSPDTVVVVAICDSSSRDSAIIEALLHPLAAKYSTTRFIKLPYEIADMDPEVVPLVLAYKSGELFANLPRVVDEIPTGQDIDFNSFELFMRQEGILKDG